MTLKKLRNLNERFLMMSIKESIIEKYGEDSSLLFADGFDDAIIGIASRCGMEDVVAYSVQKIIDILINRDDMNMDEAWEHYHFNIVGAYVGEMTPIFIDTDSDAE